MALVCRGINEAIEVINGYMAMPPTQAVKG